MIYLKKVNVFADGRYEIEDGIRALFNSKGKFECLENQFFGSANMIGDKYAPLYMKDDILYAVDDVTATNIGDGFINLTLEIAKSKPEEIGYLLFFSKSLARERISTNGQLLFSRYVNGDSLVLIKENEYVIFECSENRRKILKVENGELIPILWKVKKKQLQ